MTVQHGDGARTSLRTRIVLPMILMAALTLAASGAIVATIQYREIHSTMDQHLTRTRDELRLLADEGVDPGTGQPFAGPSELLRTYLMRTVVGEAEGEVAFVGGDVKWVASSDVTLRLEGDPQLVDAVRTLALGDEIVIRSLQTDQRDYRVLVAPVVFPTGQGALVHVFDVDLTFQQLRNTMLVYATVAVAMLAVASLIAWPLVGRLLRPIDELRVAADSIDEGDLTTRVPVTGRHELAALSATINRMLDRVQRSVEAQRRLLDDVGHELRTPITVVRGHLELVDVADPDDVVQTRELAIDELDRMGALVGDLLVLAKAGQADFVVPRWSDLAALTDRNFEKARTLGERNWRLEEVADVEAWVDPTRITQAWLQLAANAVKYSETGSVIALGSRLHRGVARLWVRDSGIGIAADQLARVRERFARAPEASTHAQGAGLGLSIVESILAAHHGRLEIESTPGAGSTFTMILPLAPVDDATEETA